MERLAHILDSDPSVLTQDQVRALHQILAISIRFMADYPRLAEHGMVAGAFAVACHEIESVAATL